MDNICEDIWEQEFNPFLMSLLWKPSFFLFFHGIFVFIFIFIFAKWEIRVRKSLLFLGFLFKIFSFLNLKFLQINTDKGWLLILSRENQHTSEILTPKFCHFDRLIPLMERVLTGYALRHVICHAFIRPVIFSLLVVFYLCHYF